MIRVYSEIVYNEKGKEVLSETKLFVKPSDIAKFIDSDSFCLGLMISSPKKDVLGVIPEFLSLGDAIQYMETKLTNPRWESHIRGWKKDRAEALLKYLKYMLNKPKKLKCINN